jgi:hypothetical protein
MKSLYLVPLPLRSSFCIRSALERAFKDCTLNTKPRAKF